MSEISIDATPLPLPPPPPPVPRNSKHGLISVVTYVTVVMYFQESYHSFFVACIQENILSDASKKIEANNGIIKLGRCHAFRKVFLKSFYSLCFISKQIIVNYCRNEIGALATCYGHKGPKLKSCTKLC